MKQRTHLSSVVLILLLGTAPGLVVAQTAGSWVAKLGVNRMTPHVDSDDLTAPSPPGAKVDMKADTSLIFTATYFYTDNLSVEAYAGLSYKHDIVGKGSLEPFGKLASVRQVSPTVFGQWRFGTATTRVRPYLGLGLTYAYFFDEKGSDTLTALTAPGSTSDTRVSTDAAWGVSPQLGATVQVDDRWSIDAAVIKTYVKTKTHLSTGQSIEHRLDPVSVNVSVAYRF